MLKRELKVNLKFFIIWLLILVIMFLVVYLIYPYVITDEGMKDIDELLKVFPAEVLKAFNMDLESISTAFGWVKTEGFVFVLLAIGFYSSTLGGTILLKEEDDKTIEYLNSLPITRSKIVTNKVIVGIIYILLLILLFGLFNYIALTISEDFSVKEFVLLSITPIFIALPLFGINLFISTFLHKTKKTAGICLGMVFIFYLLNMLSELSTKVEFLKYFSIYTLADVRNVISTTSIDINMIIISLVITFVFIILTYIRYNKKELV
ncbi:MAG: ABC transporter permease subunit [Bacilli bacterium]|nr:ABC transporter permease subunit [Bacilli bacterium]